MNKSKSFINLGIVLLSTMLGLLLTLFVMALLTSKPKTAIAKEKDNNDSMSQMMSFSVQNIPISFCDTVTEIPQNECEALISLYNNTDGNNWINNTGWGDTITPCSWYGLYCHVAGHITQISLNGNQLEGTMPSQLGNLSNLRYLGMGFNQLSGSVPPELGNLNELQKILLDENGLTGSIPGTLGNLHNLEELRLAWNQLSGSIPPELGNLSSLEILYLDGGNQLTGTIPTEFGNLSNLLELQLSSNQLNGSIPAELGNLSNLQGLGLQSNQLSGEVPFSITNLISLTWSDIGFNELIASNPIVVNYLNEKDPDWADSKLPPLEGVALHRAPRRCAVTSLGKQASLLAFSVFVLLRLPFHVFENSFFIQSDRTHAVSFRPHMLTPVPFAQLRVLIKHTQG